MMIVLCFLLPHLILVLLLLDFLLHLIWECTGLELLSREMLPLFPPLLLPLCKKFTLLPLLLLLLLKDQDKYLFSSCFMNLLTTFKIIRNCLLQKNRTFSATYFSQSAAILTTTYLMQHQFCLPPPYLWLLPLLLQ